MRALASAIARQATAPPTAGLGAPAPAFAATVLSTAPLRVQAQGIDVAATAIVGLTLTIAQTVLVVTVGSTYYVIGRLT